MPIRCTELRNIAAGLLFGVFAWGAVLDADVAAAANKPGPASRSCQTQSAGAHEAYQLAPLPSLPEGVTALTDWRANPKSGGWYGAQIMDGCRIRLDEVVSTWHGKPAARIEVNPGDDPLALGSNSERAEMMSLQDKNGRQILENASSGTQFYATSFFFPENWRGQQLPWSAFAPLDCSAGSGDQCNSWSFVLQFYGWGALAAAQTSPNGPQSFFLTVGDEKIPFSDGGRLALGKWIDLVFRVDWGSGYISVWRRDEGEAGFRQVVSVKAASPSKGVYLKQGLYRGGNVGGRTDVLWLGPTARGNSFAAVELAAFGTSTGGPVAASCTFNGRTVVSGESVTAFATSAASEGQTCFGERRLCKDGVLSGSKTFENCSGPVASRTCQGKGTTTEAYHLPPARVPGGAVSFLSNWEQVPKSGGLLGLQAMDECRIHKDQSMMTWHGKPTARIEVNPGDDPIDSGGERAELLFMQDQKGAAIKETRAVGTQFYAFSYYFPTTWDGTQISGDSDSWSAVLQFHPDDAGGPLIGLGAGRHGPAQPQVYWFDAGSRHLFSDGGQIALGKWTDFVLTIDWGKGNVQIYRRDEGQKNFRQVLKFVDPTMLPAASAYFKQGLYRGTSVNGRSDVLWIGPVARGTSFADVEAAAFDTNNGP
jgi:hypothetical protein